QASVPHCLFDNLLGLVQTHDSRLRARRAEAYPIARRGRDTIFEDTCARFFTRFRGFRWNFINRPWTHEVLAAGWLHDFFFDTQMVKKRQNFKERSRVLVFDIRGTSSGRHDKVQESAEF